MKTIFKSIILVIAVLSSTTFFAQKKEINTAESTIKWIGKKITGSHDGTLKFSSGYLTFDGDNITGGEFVVDMTSLQVTDLKAGQGKEKLEGHLNSDDFFGVANHKTAKLVIGKSKKTDKGYVVKGDLTIKGKTNPTEFVLVVKGDKASVDVNIDRTKYGIKYGSGSFFDNLGDKAISDEFTLEIALKM